MTNGLTKAEELQKAFGFISMNELHYLQELARGIEQSPVVVLNIGAGPGTSGVGFAESREDLILHTCDMSDKSNPHGCLESERDWMKRAGQWHRWEKTWFQHHMSSHDLDDIWAKLTNFLTIDLLFIDGDHTAKGVRRRYLWFLPVCSYGRVDCCPRLRQDKCSITSRSDGKEGNRRSDQGSQRVAAGDC